MADNRRVRMTKKLIKDAYLELLESNPSEKISVTDVCKVADVNRSTFYMYYEDTIALRHDIENDVMDQIPVLSDMPSEITTDKQFVDILERFFSYIEENSRMFRILILQSDNRAFNRRLIDAVLEKIKMCKAILIICDEKDPICEFVMKTLVRGATYTPCFGAYTDKPHYMIYTTLTRREADQLQDFIHRQHLNAFMSMLSTTEVFGKGFKHA